MKNVKEPRRTDIDGHNSKEKKHAYKCGCEFCRLETRICQAREKIKVKEQKRTLMRILK
jgi:hypothetical protein